MTSRVVWNHAKGLVISVATAQHDIIYQMKCRIFKDNLKLHTFYATRFYIFNPKIALLDLDYKRN